MAYETTFKPFEGKETVGNLTTTDGEFSFTASVNLDVTFEDVGSYLDAYSEDPDIVTDVTENMRVGSGVTAGTGADSFDAILGMIISAPNAPWSIFPAGSFPPYNPARIFTPHLVR